MSVCFYIKNKNRFFAKQAPMTIKECLELSNQKITQFSFDETADDFDENRFYNSSIADYEVLILGVYGQNSRGFELSFEKEKNACEVRVCTPSTKEDWEIALRYIKELARKLKSTISTDREEHFSKDNIESFDYKKDILIGLQCFCYDDSPATMTGLFREVCLNKEYAKKFLDSQNPIESFSNFFHDIQYLDAYSAKQRFFKDKDTDEIFGLYTLTQETRTILPFKPAVEFKYTNSVKDDDVKSWKMSFCIIDGDENNPDSYHNVGMTLYSDFISHLPKDKYRFIDASHILVEELSQDEILELAGNKK